ncbi:MAG: hypothetical protein INR73_08195 [Williamsia sp.]|nr:hypothetical protein [Williamsia sp.]
MFNPFIRFMPELIDAFRKKGEPYLVSHTFKAGVDVFTPGKTALMFSQYANNSHAQVHLQTVKADRWAALIDLENEKHRNKVLEMLLPASSYLVFSNLTHDNETVVNFTNKYCADKLQRYLKRHTNWRNSSYKNLRPKIQLIYGEMFIVVQSGSQQLRIKFTEIENY